MILSNLTKAFVLIFSVGLFSHAWANTTLCKKIGVNVSGVSYYGSELPFVDLMKISKGWERPWGTANQEHPLELTEQGYPLRISPSASLVNIVHDDRWSRSANENVYELSWDGSGTIFPHKNAVKIYKSSANQVTFKVIQPGRLWVDLKATDQLDPVRNIRFVPVASEKDQVFRQRFLSNWKQMRLYRFMQWGNTNNSKLKDWSERRRPDFSTQATGGKGVAYEHMIELANKQASDLWINVPHEASDDYVRQMAVLFKENVLPGRKIYVEYTNEYWNSMFSQFKYLHALGKQTNRDVNEAYVDRALQVFDIWRRVFAGDGRLKVVLAGQFANPWLTDKLLSFKEAGKKVDGFAIGYYAGYDIGAAKNFSWLLSATPDDVINKLRNEAIPESKKLLNEQVAIIKKHRIPVLAYEAGQHLAATGVDPSGKPLIDNEKVVNLLIAANRHPGMSGIYRAMLENWEQAGGDVIAFFGSTAEPGKWGSWGLRENEAQAVADAPKLKGIYDYCGW